MKIILLMLIIMSIIIITSCVSMNSIKGSGKIVSEDREFTNFNSIKLLGSIDVTINYSDNYNCTVRGDDNLISFIKTEVVNNNLQISINKSYSTTEGLVVNVNAQEYDEVSISGSGDINIIDFKNETLSLNINGSGDITANGEVNTLFAKISGSGDIISTELKSKSVTITINGSGDAKIWASDSISVKINGSGDIEYYGNPTNVESKINGSGELLKNSHLWRLWFGGKTINQGVKWRN